MSSRGVNASAWYAGTAVVIVLVLAGSWFGFSSAKMSSAATIRDEVEQTEHRNRILNTRVQALRADFEKLDEYRAEIADLAVGIPEETQFSTFIETAANLADEHEVFIADIQPVAPVTIVPVATVPEESDGDDGASPEAPEADGEDSSSDAQSDSSTAEPAVVEGFAGLPMMFTVVGETPNVNAFLDELQNLDRLFLPTIIRQERLDPVDATGGMPEILEGWIQMDLTGYVFVFSHALSEPADSGLGEMPRETDRNPFIPIEGGEGSGTDSEDDEDGEPES